MAANTRLQHNSPGSFNEFQQTFQGRGIIGLAIADVEEPDVCCNACRRLGTAQNECARAASSLWTQSRCKFRHRILQSQGSRTRGKRINKICINRAHFSFFLLNELKAKMAVHIPKLRNDKNQKGYFETKKGRQGSQRCGVD